MVSCPFQVSLGKEWYVCCTVTLWHPIIMPVASSHRHNILSGCIYLILCRFVILRRFVLLFRLTVIALLRFPLLLGLLFPFGWCGNCLLLIFTGIRAFVRVGSLLRLLFLFLVSAGVAFAVAVKACQAFLLYQVNRLFDGRVRKVFV